MIGSTTTPFFHPASRSQLPAPHFWPIGLVILLRLKHRSDEISHTFVFISVHSLFLGINAHFLINLSDRNQLEVATFVDVLMDFGMVYNTICRSQRPRPLIEFLHERMYLHIALHKLFPSDTLYSPYKFISMMWSPGENFIFSYDNEQDRLKSKTAVTIIMKSSGNVGKAAFK